MKHEVLIKFPIYVLCVFSTIILVGLWIHRYSLDKDMAVIESRNYFSNPDDVFPVMSLCFNQSFQDHYFKKWGSHIRGSDYRDFLFGEHFDEAMTKIDFSSVTTNISDFVLFYKVEYRNGTFIDNTIDNIAWKPLYYTLSWNSWGVLVKCFGLEITDKNVYDVRLFMKREIFPENVRNADGGFAVLFHYPNQILASLPTIKRQWIKRDSATNHYMGFDLKSADVNVQRYKKSQQNCIPDWKNYDNITLERHLEKVGCKTPDQITNNTWSICSSKEKMKEARLPFNTINLRPCTEIETIEYEYGDYEDYDGKYRGLSFHGKYWKNWICFVYRILNPRFRVISQEKEVDFQTLIGYIGGYIGIFTGFALIEIPDFVFAILGFFKKWKNLYWPRENTLAKKPGE